MPTYKVPKLRRQPRTAAGPRRIVIVTNAAADSLEYIGLLQVFAEVRFFLREAGYPQAYTVEIGNVALYFSYRTLIAVRAPNVRARVDFNHSRTTVKHHSQLGCAYFPHVSEAELERLAREALKSNL